MNNWPFDYPPSLAVLSLRRIVIDANASVLMVIHDDDGSMQFLDAEDINEEDAATLALSEIIDLDPTLTQVACLPVGFIATRETVGGPWQLFLAGDPDDDSPNDSPDSDE